MSEPQRFIDLLIAASPMERKRVSVIGQPLYIRPLTRKEMADAFPKDKVERDPDYTGLFLLVACCEFENGDKVFTVKDVDAMRERVSLSLMQELESAMMGVLTPSVQEAQADLAANPPSTTG